MPRHLAADDAVFLGRRWRLLVVGSLLVGVGVVLLAAALIVLVDLLFTYRGYNSSGISAAFLGAVIFAVVGAAALLPGWWRLRIGLRPPRLTIGPHSLRAECGGQRYERAWPQVARADVIRLGRREVLAVWPARPTGPWGAGLPRPVRRNPKGRYRFAWYNPVFNCDIVMDMALLRGRPARGVSAALGEVSAATGRSAPGQDPRRAGPTGGPTRPGPGW
ncbi:hypothetical protein [Frankia sp. ArI3]|uniref:hypothetical protein n=1 Tax=Frankia sp. ArI3 TaxID=1858 RepID=UPI00210687F5|nr:hypothetical protein [Frankia sp. ArI3]